MSKLIERDLYLDYLTPEQAIEAIRKAAEGLKKALVYVETSWAGCYYDYDTPSARVYITGEE